MVTFYDIGTKPIELYYTKGHTNDEMKLCHQKFEAQVMPLSHAALHMRFPGLYEQ